MLSPPTMYAGVPDRPLVVVRPVQVAAVDGDALGAVGVVDEALVDAGAVEVGPADRVRVEIGPVDVPVVDRHALGKDRAGDEVLVSPRPVVLALSDGVGELVDPVEVRGAGLRRGRRRGGEREARGEQESSSDGH
jgi:hypothetical protein